MAMKVDRTRVFDMRVVQRYIRAGRVTKEEYAAWLAALPDGAQNIMPAGEGGDYDGYEADDDDDDDYDDDDDDDDMDDDDDDEPAAAAPVDPAPASADDDGDAGPFSDGGEA